MSAPKIMPVEECRPAEEVFDAARLHNYVMGNQELAAEVAGLFLVQLPAMLRALDDAASQKDWAFATHALKGSAAVIGAPRLQHLMAELEAIPFDRESTTRRLRIEVVRAAAATLRQALRAAYPAAG